MSVWVDDFECPRCGNLCSTPIWDDGSCPECGLEFRFINRDEGIIRPVEKDIEWDDF